MLFPYLKTDNEYVNKAYRLAVSTVFCNIIPYYQKQCGDIVLAAGLEYPAPWTRDASINTWNICGLLCPSVTETTLLSVLNEDYVIGGYAGQNWDNIIWAIGAWYQYLYTGNIDFLNIAYMAVTTTLKEFEESEFNDKENLFIGPACYGDGVSAYDDKYAVHGSGAIAEYPLFNTMELYTLSTNCLFYEAYVIVDKMADVLGKEKMFAENASKLKNAINNRFWSEERGMYYYYIDESGTNNSMEALGNSFAILFGIADDRQKNLIFKNQYITNHGIPCVWPAFARYAEFGENCFGRHSGTVWPFIQGFWADAACKNKQISLFDGEFTKQTENAIRSAQFSEIYHPLTGKPYGGLQENDGKISETNPAPFQTWSATAYLRNIFMNIFGMRFETNGIYFEPCSTSIIKDAEISGIIYRNSKISLKISGSGNFVKEFKVNGRKFSKPFFSAESKGKFYIEILMS